VCVGKECVRGVRDVRSAENGADEYLKNVRVEEMEGKKRRDERDGSEMGTGRNGTKKQRKKKQKERI
jgi:hypothetical protein